MLFMKHSLNITLGGQRFSQPNEIIETKYINNLKRYVTFFPFQKTTIRKAVCKDIWTIASLYCRFIKQNCFKNV